MCKISVVIPVYNCEKFLPVCLDSIILQTYENLEIICINDGSKDDSLKLLEEYELKDSRIKVINQKNQGQSAARNRGIEEASGDFISFIDADDWVSLCLYEKFVKMLDKSGQNIDIFLFNGTNFNDKNQHCRNTSFFGIKDWNNYEQKDFIHTFNDCKKPFSGNMSVWNKIYGTEFLRKNNIKFAENLIFEDQLFFMETSIKAKSILICNDALYHYRQQNTASTMSTLGKNVFDIFRIINRIEKILKDTNNYEEYKYAFFQHKYMQFAFLFFRAKLFLKPRFYDEMKARLLLVEHENLNIDICKHLYGYDIYKDIIKLKWYDFYLKHRKNIIY